VSGWLQAALAISALVEVARRFVAGGEPESTLMIAMASVALVANAACLWLVSMHREGGAHMMASTIFSTNDVIANLGVIAAACWLRLPGLSIGPGDRNDHRRDRAARCAAHPAAEVRVFSALRADLVFVPLDGRSHRWHRAYATCA